MANEKYGTTMTAQRAQGRAFADDTEDITSAPRATATTQAPRYSAGPAGPSESQFAVGEVTGDAPPRGPAEFGAEAAHEEAFSGEATEAGEEYIEATAAELAAAESGEETAVSDLRGVEGFVEAQEAAEEGAVAIQRPVHEAGEAVEGAQEAVEKEFLPFLAALAPTLISTVGPAVAKLVSSKLKPGTRSKIQRIAAKAKPIVGGAVKGVAGAVGGGGASSLLALIAKLLETAQQAPTKAGEAGMEVDEALVEQAVAAIEVVIGTDDRVQVTQTTEVPWRRLCALRITFPSGATYRGTGFLIGARAVATAGHCVYLHNQGGWARKVEVIPGCNGSARPYGQVESTMLRSVGGWVTGKKPESDYGCIVLPSGAFGGRNLGSFGFAAFDSTALLAQPAVVTGYPGDKPFAEMWGMARKIKALTAKTLVYDIDTMGGQSGAPVYIKRNGQRYVVGIHNYGAATGNSATRVTQPVYQRLLGWSKL